MIRSAPAQRNHTFLPPAGHSCKFQENTHLDERRQGQNVTTFLYSVRATLTQTLRGAASTSIQRTFSVSESNSCKVWRGMKQGGFARKGKLNGIKFTKVHFFPPPPFFFLSHDLSFFLFSIFF